MKIATCKYPIGEPRNFTVFAEKQTAFLREAKEQGAALAVLPEYLSLELAAMFGEDVRSDLHASLAALQPLHGEWMALFSQLAQTLQMQIVAGTFLLDVGGGRYRNRSYLFAPAGGHLWQDKLRLTGFEKQTGVIEPGDALKVFDIGEARAGIAVCYDSEFPLPVRAQSEAGARLLLVPSCTDTDAGATRVRVGCLARALENRCFVAQSVTADEAPWSPALDVNTGEAALIAPMDTGWPADGIVAQTAGSQHWAVADLDFAALESSRANAQVAVDRDWPAQYFPSVQRARLTPLQPGSAAA